MADPEQVKRLLAGVEEWNRWRIGSVQPIRLANADLSGACLRGANLEDADLSGATLMDADLSLDLVPVRHSNARVHRTNLRGATLYGANLLKANLLGAELSGANLVRALLLFTNLAWARLLDADLTDALLQSTVFGGTEMNGARGLELCNFAGPSPLDLETIRRSGPLPPAFLRGCGLPEDFINYLPSLLAQPIQFYSCFISYSKADLTFARWLHDRLQGHGVRCWLDEHQLLPGDDLHEGIDQGIRLWDKVLLCASKSSLNSWWVDGEINRAFQKEAQLMKERGKRVLALIPLNLDGFLFSSDYKSGKKTEITSRVAANFVGSEHDVELFEQELEKVLRALRSDKGGRETPPTARL